MSDATCREDPCTDPAVARGWCNRHYAKARRENRLSEGPRRSRLSDIDPEAGTVTCSVHGPGARLRIRSGNRGRYECARCSRSKMPRTPTSRADWLRWKYDLTEDEFDAMVEAQGGRCLICCEVPDEQLVVDHDHGTGVVRGLLCRCCNIGLGFMRDDPERLRRAADYLTTPKESVA